MLSNKLKINDSKTEFIILGTSQQLKKIKINHIKVGDTDITPVESVKNLGVVFDDNLKMDKHITKVCSKAFYHIYNIKQIRKFLSKDATETLVHAFISSQLDYCNALLTGLPTNQLHKLQVVQNSAARMICFFRRYEHITPTLMNLHWLPVEARIKYKVILLTFKAIHGTAPEYLQEMIQVTGNSAYALRSNCEIQLLVPKHRHSTTGRRAFAVSAPLLWNSLPVNLRTESSPQTFKKMLKTHLFQVSYSQGR